MPVGNASNNTWEVRASGELNTYDGQGGVDTLSFGRLQRSDFTITRNADGTVSVDSIAGAAAYFRLRLINVELLTFNGGTVLVDLRTTQSATDTVAPRLNSVNVTANGARLELTYSETLDATRLPDPQSFTVTVNGRSFSPSSISAEGQQLVLELGPHDRILVGQTVTLAYADPTTGNDANAVQDRSGNDAVSVSSQTVQNQSTQTHLEFNGGNAHDDLGGTDDPDRLSGAFGDDTLTGLKGDDILDGGAGRDTARFSGLRGQHTIAVSTDGTLTVTGPEGTDRLLNIERVSFGDTTVAFDVAGTGGKAYRLYRAAFDRTPDAEGLGFWIDALDKGFDLKTAADNFLNSAEFTRLYGTNPTPEQFVTLLYRHVHHREPDAPGKQFWVDAMNNAGGAFGRAWSRGEVLLEFAESNENHVALVGVLQAGFEYKPYAATPG